MEVTNAILADYVQVQQGKLYVIGGGIDTLFSASSPVNHPSLGLAIQITLSPGELGRLHKVEILLMNADGARMGTINAQIQAERPPQGTAGWPVTVPLAINYPNVTFPSFGTYQFELMVNNTSLRTLQFRVMSAPSSTPKTN